MSLVVIVAEFMVRTTTVVVCAPFVTNFALKTPSLLHSSDGGRSSALLALAVKIVIS